uniref:HPS1 biogenesis of lysosomal organelles complex 3 subunit 1 n=1 Tax=Callorhinchus milii TaxID=7868 RepID=A0A4W3I8C5_CALMI
MKCLLIASESAEVLFYWTDPDFDVSLQQRFAKSAVKHGEVPATEDSINTLFAPLLISCITLNEKLSDTYTSFVSENQHLFVLHQFAECTYIAVNGDGSENEDDLRRKIFVLKKIIDLHFGLVTLDASLLKKELRPQDTEQRHLVWKMLQSMLVTYSRLTQEDQSFLVEAVERLIHPQLCERCIEFLDRQVVQQINGRAERASEEVVHAFILVHTKLLAFFSSRNASSVKPSDLLSLILIAQDMYPSNGQLETQAGKVRFPGFVWGEGANGERLHVKYSGLYRHSVPRRIFLDANLKEHYCPMMPHNMYCMSLWPAISLVLLTKIPSSHVAVSLHQLLDAFTVLEAKLNEGQEVGHAPRAYPNMADLRHRMDKFIKAVATRERPVTITIIILALCVLKHLKALHRIYLLSSFCVTFRGKLMDWKEFLLVKNFPGLIHFIYVDRTAGQMIAPAINMIEKPTSELGKGPVAAFIKNKVWSLVGLGRRYLQKGYTTLTFRDGDYYCCYFLWFENETGYKLPGIELPMLSDDSAPIGILTGDYYRKLLRYYSKNHSSEVIKCFELLTIHLGVVPTQFIIQQCCDLARKLWEPSRIPLL